METIQEFIYYLFKYAPFFLAVPAIGYLYFYIQELVRDRKKG